MIIFQSIQMCPNDLFHHTPVSPSFLTGNQKQMFLRMTSQIYTWSNSSKRAVYICWHNSNSQQRAPTCSYNPYVPLAQGLHKCTNILIQYTFIGTIQTHSREHPLVGINLMFLLCKGSMSVLTSSFNVHSHCPWPFMTYK